MYEEAVVLLAKKLRPGGKTYAEVGSILSLSLFSARKDAFPRNENLNLK